MGFRQRIDYPNGHSTLGSAYTSGSGSFVLAGGGSAFFGSVAPSAENPVRFTVASASSPSTCTHYECTGVASDTITGVTVLSGTDRNYTVGDNVFSSLYAEDFADIQSAIPSVPSLPLSVTNGGTGGTSLTAHAVMLGEGTASVGVATTGVAGRLLIDQGASADPAFEAMSGDATIAANGVITIAMTGGVAFAASATTDATNASNITSGTLSAARMPAPSASALGGVRSVTSTLHQWIAYIDTSGVPHQSQPAFSDLSGSLAISQLPALTGDTTTAAGSGVTTTGKVNGVSYPASPSTNTVPVVTASNIVTYEAVPNAALANPSITVAAGPGLSGGGVVPLGGVVTLSLSTPVSVTNGGTGAAGLTAYAVLCGGTTPTGSLQSVASVGAVGQVLTSNGPGALPTFQTLAPGGSSLTPTTTKTANYVASAGDLVLCDCSAGSFTVTLPTSPADRSTIGVLLVNAAAAVNGTAYLTIAAGGSNTIDNGSNTSIYLSATSSLVVLQYSASSGTWYETGRRAGPDIRVFTSSGIWTKPTWAVRVDVLGIGSGAGGNNGNVGAAGTTTTGGTGGGGGAASLMTFVASDLPATVSATVGAGGAAGSAGTGSQFGYYLVAGGGRTGSSNNSFGQFPGGGGGSVGSGGGGNGGNGISYSANGGGGGGGINSANTAFGGGTGGNTQGSTGSVLGGTSGSSGGGAGGAGNSSNPATYAPGFGTGGGGGGASVTGNGGNGGNGASYGGGGGGGGAAQTGFSAGTGGTGGAGILMVISS